VLALTAAMVVGVAGAVVATAPDPAGAETPPTGAGNLLPGFLRENGGFRTIDHSDAGTTVDSNSSFGTGTAAGGINDEGDIVEIYPVITSAEAAARVNVDRRRTPMTAPSRDLTRSASGRRDRPAGSSPTISIPASM
jgi:hypothetical protein